MRKVLRRHWWTVTKSNKSDKNVEARVPKGKLVLKILTIFVILFNIFSISCTNFFKNFKILAVLFKNFAILLILNSVQYFYRNVIYWRSIYYVVIVKGSKNWNIFNRIFFNFFWNTPNTFELLFRLHHVWWRILWGGWGVSTLLFQFNSIRNINEQEAYRHTSI